MLEASQILELPFKFLKLPLKYELSYFNIHLMA